MVGTVNKYADDLLKLRSWLNASLPSYGSAAALDLMLFIIANLNGGQGARLKDLYRSLPYSESNIRRYLRLMEKDGWIVVRKDDHDLRNHIALPTLKLLGAFRDYVLRSKRLADGLTESGLSEWYSSTAPASAERPPGEADPR